MRAEIRQVERTLIAGLTGDWELGNPAPSFDRLVDDRPPGQPLDAIAFETAELGEWDSSLLTFLLQGMNYCEAHGLEFQEGGLPENIVRLLALAQAVPEKPVEREQPEASLLARIGAKGFSTFDAFLISVAFVGEVASSLARLLRGRVRLRWRDFWVVVQSNSSGALPIVTLISFLVGLIIAFLGAVVLMRFGAGYYVSYLVGYGMLREMGALMTGIIIAGRTGA
ncbi:MAG TPA: ABC transporter permease, partial [Longimicrobiaceae bacterium]|nr:ABC transporter permease [Longimicrobiaceae bacterium]